MFEISAIISFFKSGMGKVVIIGTVVLGIGTYIFILTNKLDSALEEKKYAENNVILITTEFDRLYDLQTQLEADVIKQQQDHEYALVVLKKRHKREILRTTELTKINEGIKNVKPEDDGTVANILNDTLDALRVYK